MVLMQLARSIQKRKNRIAASGSSEGPKAFVAVQAVASVISRAAWSPSFA
ncbi:hypothetical protein [Paenibacillus sp. YIM B09110]